MGMQRQYKYNKNGVMMVLITAAGLIIGRERGNPLFKCCTLIESTVIHAYVTHLLPEMSSYIAFNEMSCYYIYNNVIFNINF